MDMPLDRGRRESGTAAWLLAVACRTEFRERLGEVFLRWRRDSVTAGESAKPGRA
ncbi:DUF6000 family protein [Streptomyces sp. DH10]|uniref:DUF6000 family protein n=1 Tax=Streptomyces sp. DH10 TaxID=3040121 RepID=UPI003FA7B47D